MSTCVPSYDVCVTRGDSFSLDVGLTAAFTEVAADPTDWEGHMVFREAQDDDTTPYLTLTAAPDVLADPLPDEVQTYLRFAADPTETQSLPRWDHVHYVELTYIGPPLASGGVVKRLFEGDVYSND